MVTMLSALEIFTNPHDLEIVIGRGKKIDGKYAIAIHRGPGHNFKTILSSGPFAEKVEDAVEQIKKILELIHEVCMKEFGNKESILSENLNPDGQPVDQSKILNPNLIEWIVGELQQHQVASTYKIQVVP